MFRRTKGRTEGLNPWGVTSPLGNKVHPWGRLQSWGTNFAPRGDVKTGLCLIGVVNSVDRWLLFKPKIPILGKFWRALYSKMLTYFMAIWNVSWTFGILYEHLAHFFVHLVHFFRFWYHVQRKIWQPWWSSVEPRLPVERLLH
jgi:hypothetical protein